MPMDPELKLRVEWDEVRSAYIDAKKTRAKDPEGYAKAKAAMSKMRRRWRDIRDAVAVQAAAGDATAALSSIETTSKVK